MSEPRVYCPGFEELDPPACSGRGLLAGVEASGSGRRVALRSGRFMGVLSVLSLLAAGLAGGEGGAAAGTSAAPAPGEAGAAEPVSLLIDYLPSALYEKEPLTACFRLLSKDGKATRARVVAVSQDAQGRSLPAQEDVLELRAGGATNFQKDYELRGVRRIRFGVKVEGREIQGPMVRVVGEGERWPESAVREGRLVEAGTGEVLVLVVARRKKDEQRTWSPLRWVLGTDAEQGAGSTGALQLYLPGAWALEHSAAEGRPGRLDFQELVPLGAGGRMPVALGPYVFDGAAPILKALGEGLAQTGAGAVARVVLCLPPEDLEVGTDPRVYQITLEAWLARLVAAGAKGVLVVPPFGYGLPRKRQELLWQAVEAAARVSGAEVLEVKGLLDERYWRIDPAQRGVYGRRPNSEGRKAFAQKLEERMAGEQKK